jgi:hypothetical protein
LAGERTLVFADLHFEKGSSYARSGTMLPPYDTRATLARVTALVALRTQARHRAGRFLPRSTKPRTGSTMSSARCC